MRLAIISDIHEDISSLRKILGRIERVGYDRLVCLGDICGFSIPHYNYRKMRNAHECLSILREKESIIVPGNHDLHAAKVVPRHSPVFDFPDDWYEMDYHMRSSHANNKIWLHEEDDMDPLYTTEDIKYLRTLSEYRVLEESGIRILLSHYVYPNMSGFRKGFYSTAVDFREHFEFMENHGCLFSFTGHAHVRGFYVVSPGRFTQYRYRRLTLNATPTIIGIQPVTNHQRRSGFCIFDTEHCTLQAVRY